MKVGAQFRISRALIDIIDANTVKGQRSQWIANAITKYMRSKKNRRKMKISAVELLTDKVTVLLRVDISLLDRLDEYCEVRKISRTVVLLDACISRLVREGICNDLERSHQKSTEESTEDAIR